MAKSLYPFRSQEWSHDNNSTPAPPLGTLRARVIRLAERVTTPLVPADYLDVIDPLRTAPTCAAASSRSTPRPATPSAW